MDPWFALMGLLLAGLGGCAYRALLVTDDGRRSTPVPADSVVLSAAREPEAGDAVVGPVAVNLSSTQADRALTPRSRSESWLHVGSARRARHLVCATVLLPSPLIAGSHLLLEVIISRNVRVVLTREFPSPSQVSTKHSRF